MTADPAETPPPDEQPRARRPSRRQVAVGIVAGLVVVVLIVAALFLRPAVRPSPAVRIAPGEAPPPAEPLVFAPIPEETARKLNEAIPLARERGPAARPFAWTGAAESRERAIDCLASAMLYEAGGDARGQEAVAQVVLNRVRHPAYPGTVCGVVFQGSERRTGCQFTFTCDGAMRRVPSPSAFALARSRARAMLEGRVRGEVGLATHYHTDWVHPIWSGKLEKIARVDTHLFFRWSGLWGSPAAHRKRYAGGEPAVPALALLSPFHRVDPMVAATAAADARLAGGVSPPVPQPVDLGGGRFRVFMSPARNGNVQAAVALDLCGTRDYCKLTGVLDQPGTTGRQPVVFVYLRDRAAAFERVKWDCDVFRRPSTVQCFNGPRDIAEPPAPSASGAAAEVAATGKTPS